MARENEVLLDITTALALFVENVKLHQTLQFNSVLAAVDDDLRKLFARVNYKSLDGLSKAELNRLLLSLRKSQARIYSAYTEKLIASLQDFMQVRLEVSAVAYASAKSYFLTGEAEQFSERQAFAFIERQSEVEPFSPLYGLAAILPSGKPSLWSTIKNAPIPANGLLLLPFINGFARAAQANVENTIRKAYANRQTIAETLAELNGSRSKQGNSTQLAKIQAQASAVIDTAFAHVDQVVSQGVTSSLFAHYGWLSIIDSSTTQVCRERDKKAFRFGQGPVPPAHYRCRSITVPLSSLLADFSAPTLYAWLKKQSPDFVREFLGREAASMLQNGELTAKDFASLSIGKALPLTQLKSKLGLILSSLIR